jgi:hypothetical protein
VVQLIRVSQHQEQGLLVIPAQAGIQCRNLDSRLRRNDEIPKSRFEKALVVVPKPGLALVG